MQHAQKKAVHAGAGRHRKATVLPCRHSGGQRKYPSNDENCLGYLLEDVDVTMGDAPGTYVYQGTIDYEKVKNLSPTITEAARKATPRVTFYGATALSQE